MTVETRVPPYGALLTALQDRTRGLILSELMLNGELTASMISEKLGISFTNASYHLRRLLSTEVIEPSRKVVAGFRVEKYYQIRRELLQVLPMRAGGFVNEVYQTLEPQERQIVHCAWLAMAGNLLVRAAERYQHMNTQHFDRLFDEEELMLLGLGTMSREPLKQLLRIARAAIPENLGEVGPGGAAEHPDHVVFAVLPDYVLNDD